METKRTVKPYPAELRERSVRMVREQAREHASEWAAMRSVAAKVGCTAETLAVGPAGRARPGRARRVDERGTGAAEGAGTGEPGAARGQRDPAQGECVFCGGGARPPVEAMIAFIDDHRGVHGVEPICRELAIAPSTYHAHAAHRADPSKASARARATACFAAMSGGSGRRTFGSTACARSGASLAARGSGLRDAPSPA